MAGTVAADASPQPKLHAALRRPFGWFAIFAAASGLCIAWPPTFRTSATLLLEFDSTLPPASVAQSPNATALRWKAAILSDDTWRGTSQLLQPCSREESDAAKLRCTAETFDLLPTGDRGFALVVVGTDPALVKSNAAALSRRLIEFASRIDSPGGTPVADKAVWARARVATPAGTPEKEGLGVVRGTALAVTAVCLVMTLATLYAAVRRERKLSSSPPPESERNRVSSFPPFELNRRISRAPNAPPTEAPSPPSQSEGHATLGAGQAGRPNPGSGRYSYSSRAPSDSLPNPEYVRLDRVPAAPRVPSELFRETSTGSESEAQRPRRSSDAPSTERGLGVRPTSLPPLDLSEAKRTLRIGSSFPPTVEQPPEPARAGGGVPPETDSKAATPFERPSAKPSSPRMGDSRQRWDPATAPAGEVRVRKLRSPWRPPPSSPEGLKQLRDELTLLAETGNTVVLLAAPSDAAAFLAKMALEIAVRCRTSLPDSTLLVETDFEHPLLAELLGVDVPYGQGLSQQLHHHTQSDDVTWTVLDTGLGFHFLGEGRFRTPGLLWSDQFSQAIHEFRQRYSVVLIVAPRLMSEVTKRALEDVTDAAIVLGDDRPGADAPLRTGTLADKVVRTIKM